MKLARLACVVLVASSVNHVHSLRLSVVYRERSEVNKDTLMGKSNEGNIATGAAGAVTGANENYGEGEDDALFGMDVGTIFRGLPLSTVAMVGGVGRRNLADGPMGDVGGDGGEAGFNIDYTRCIPKGKGDKCVCPRGYMKSQDYCVPRRKKRRRRKRCRGEVSISAGGDGGGPGFNTDCIPKGNECVCPRGYRKAEDYCVPRKKKRC